MESRRGPKFRKRKKDKGEQISLAERIMLKREAAAQEAERNSNKSEGSSSLETNSKPNPAPQAPPKNPPEAANTSGSDGRHSPSESVDISHITKDSDPKKRTPTPEPTLSASHSDKLPGPSSEQKSPQASADQNTDNKVEAVSNGQPPQTSANQNTDNKGGVNNNQPPQTSDNQNTDNKDVINSIQQSQTSASQSTDKDGVNNIQHSQTSASQNTDNKEGVNNNQHSQTSASQNTDNKEGVNNNQPPQTSADQITGNKEGVNDIQSSYQQPLQPAYAPYLPENSLSNQSKSPQQSQHQQGQIPQQSGFQSEVGRSIPVTSNHIATGAVTTIITSSSPSSSVKGTTITHTNSSFVPPGDLAGHGTNPTHKKSHPLVQPHITNSDYNQFMSLAQKIVLQRKIVAVCDSVIRQQPQQNPGFEPNAVSTKETSTSNIGENNQLPEGQVQNMAPGTQVSCQEPCPLSDKKCPIHSITLNRESNEQGNPIVPSGTSGGQTAQTVDNQSNNAVKNGQTKNQQPMSRNGVSDQNPQEKNMLPTDPANEDLDLVDHSELEALEKMVDHDLQSLVSGTNSEENTPVINKDLKNKVLSEEFQRKIDRFLNDI